MKIKTTVPVTYNNGIAGQETGLVTGNLQTCNQQLRFGFDANYMFEYSSESGQMIANNMYPVTAEETNAFRSGKYSTAGRMYKSGPLLEGELRFSYLRELKKEIAKNNEFNSPRIIREARKELELEDFFQDLSKEYSTKPSSENTAVQKFNNGGMVYANNGALIPSLAQRTDTVPAMLTPGEFVINRESSQKHMPLLHAINSGHFNRGGIINYLANGGIVAPKYYANAGPVTGGSGSSSGVSNDISSSISAAVGQAMNAAVGQLSTALQSGMETYSQMMQSTTETLNNFGQTFSSASQTIASSANTWSETAGQIPTSLTAEITGRQVVDFTGLGREGDRIVSSAAQAGQLAGSQTSQNTIAKYDRSQFDGNLNTAANNRPMRT
jgi:hypothetical protein